jgi:hypothetical protein
MPARSSTVAAVAADRVGAATVAPDRLHAWTNEGPALPALFLASPNRRDCPHASPQADGGAPQRLLRLIRFLRNSYTPATPYDTAHPLRPTRSPAEQVADTTRIHSDGRAQFG